MFFYKLLSIIIYIIFFFIFLISSLILISAAYLHLPLFYKIDKIICRIILFSLGLSPKINGQFPKDGTFIIMMNHTSFVDVFLFPLIPTGTYTGVTAAENFKLPIFSRLIKQINAIPIDRKNIDSAINSIKIAESVLKKNIHIGILPEGTRTINGKLNSLKKGGFHMAINTKCSIVPVGISGSFKFKPKNRWWLIPCKININIGEIINSESYHRLGLEGLLQQVGKSLKILSGENNDNK